MIKIKQFWESINNDRANYSDDTGQTFDAVRRVHEFICRDPPDIQLVDWYVIFIRTCESALIMVAAKWTFNGISKGFTRLRGIKRPVRVSFLGFSIIGGKLKPTLKATEQNWKLRNCIRMQFPCARKRILINFQFGRCRFHEQPKFYAVTGE